MTEDYHQSIHKLKKDYLNEDFEQGLTVSEAEKRLLTDGPNKLETKKTPKWRLFVGQFHNMIIYILIVAALLTVLMGHFSDAVIIGFVIVINALIGYYQEANASDALEKIKEMLAAEATVYREG
ncbi:MAG: Calcium-transporting ATPase [Enterococcus gilvus]|jgi:magnesium-transporting ATPase (P-type)